MVEIVSITFAAFQVICCQFTEYECAAVHRGGCAELPANTENKEKGSSYDPAPLYVPLMYQWLGIYIRLVLITQDSRGHRSSQWEPPAQGGSSPSPLLKVAIWASPKGTAKSHQAQGLMYGGELSDSTPSFAIQASRILADARRREDNFGCVPLFSVSLLLHAPSLWGFAKGWFGGETKVLMVHRIQLIIYFLCYCISLVWNTKYNEAISVNIYEAKKHLGIQPWRIWGNVYFCYFRFFTILQQSFYTVWLLLSFQFYLCCYSRESSMEIFAVLQIYK